MLRKPYGNAMNQQNTVTPIVIRRKGSANEREKEKGRSINFNFDSEDNMELDDDESGERSRGNGETGPAPEPAPGIPVAVPVVVPGQIGEKSIFHTSRAEGGLRDVLTIECQKMNGEDFKGTITYTEATVKILEQELGFTTDILHAVKMSFNKCRIVSFKLKKRINIDELWEKENFEMKRSYIDRVRLNHQTLKTL